MGILLFQGEMILEGGITLVSFPVTVYVSGIRNSMLAKGGKTVGNFRVPGHINFIYRPRIVNVFHFLFFQVFPLPQLALSVLAVKPLYPFLFFIHQ